MQRRLVLMRHAKSSWASGAVDDHARPLNDRGLRDAPRMGAALAERGWTPQIVVSSDARRTRATWEAMQEPLGLADLEPEWMEDLYLAGLRELRRHIIRWDDALQTGLALGHNPGWSDAAAMLSGQPIAMTTANCALLEGSGATWNEALHGRWELIALLRPRELS